VPSGLDSLKHIVVLMMSSRSFDHMLGGLIRKNPAIDGLTGNESNPDTNGEIVKVRPNAQFQGQLDPGPDHRFPAVDLQIFGGSQGDRRVANMQGFVKDYFTQTNDVNRSHDIMNYFTPDKLPVLTTLATEFAVFNGWFSSVPGPAICNRAFAHYGTSFGQVGMDNFYGLDSAPSIYERMIRAGHATTIYYYDQQSSTMETVNLLRNQRQIFATYSDFLGDCTAGSLPKYSYVEPNHNDHAGPGGGSILANDQHPGHNVQEGERFIASVFNAIRANPDLWATTALLITYDQHGGIYDHVVPPPCTPDGYSATAKDTGTGKAFAFDRLGVRVPAVLVSPWIPRGTVVSGRIFEHASIPATVTSHFLGNFDGCTRREKEANPFLDLLSDQMRSDSDVPYFKFQGLPLEGPRNYRPPSSRKAFPALPALSSAKSRAKRKKAANPKTAASVSPGQAAPLPTFQRGPSTHVARDRWTTVDSLGHKPYAYAIYRFLTAEDTKPPLAISIQAPWGGGKTSLMRMIQQQLDPETYGKADRIPTPALKGTSKATVKDVLCALENASTDPSGNAKATSSVNSGSGVSSPPADTPEGLQPAIPPIKAEGRRRRVTIWFNAWKYESTTQVWAGLADSIVQQIGERFDDPVERELFWFRLQMRRLDAGKIRQKIYREVFSAFYEKIVTWAPAYLAGIGLMVLTALKSMWLGTGAFLVADLVGAWTQFRDAKSDTESKPARVSLGEFVQVPDYAANLGFVHEVVEDFKRVFAIIPKKDLPMVVFIDDLDRCSPGKVAAVVEAINLFLAGEFPDCMFILGIDDEMVAAALDKAHSEVIAKLPAYARSSSIGWRFMDKFVQLPFIMPSPSPQDLANYVDSLLSEDGPPEDPGPDALDHAAGLVEQHADSSLTPEQVVQQVADQRPLAQSQQEALKKDVKIIQEMNDNIRLFTDREESMRALISKDARKYFNNPRDMKRFVNLFRFYYFLRAAREVKEEPVVSIEQLSRWLVFSLRWPEVDRWLRRHPASEDDSASSPLAIFEHAAATPHNLAAWQEELDKSLGLKLDQTPWLADGELFTFFQTEVSDFKEGDRLSSCSDKGLW
jgi:phospholipase C